MIIIAHRALIRPDGSVFEYPIPGVDTAIKELRPGCSFQLMNNTFVEWSDPEGREPPTGEEITAEVKREEEIWWKYEYERKRGKLYPTIEHQLDLLFHDIEEGKLDKTGSFYNVIKKVKDKYPKPNNINT